MSSRVARCAVLLTAFAVFGLPAISMADDDPVPESTFVFSFAAPVDSVWDATIAYTIDQGCPLVVNDKARLTLRTAHLRALRRDIAVGGWFGSSSDVTAIVSIHMVADGDSTYVHLSAALTALLDKGSNIFLMSSEDSNWKPCKTKGQLEHRIFTEIGKRLGIEVPPLPDKFLKPRVDEGRASEVER